MKSNGQTDDSITALARGRALLIWKMILADQPIFLFSQRLKLPPTLWPVALAVSERDFSKVYQIIDSIDGYCCNKRTHLPLYICYHTTHHQGASQTSISYSLVHGEFVD